MFFLRRSKIKTIVLIFTLAICLKYNELFNILQRTNSSRWLSIEEGDDQQNEEFGRLLLHITNSTRTRGLSINLGDGECMWTAPTYDIPTDIQFFKTLIAGYPSGDKRLAFVQMEALTGLSARDEWDFKFLGITNQPFVKANYPHHEGVWGWKGVELGQVAMVVRNIKRSLVEYHDIVWDIGYAKTFDDAFVLKSNLYQERPPLEDFLVWRELRVFDEIHWYSWFIDYYMENGLMRDMFNHEVTTPEHWRKLLLPHHYTKEELRYKWYVHDPENLTPYYDPMCDTIAMGCYPARIISAEKLVVNETGPAEGRKIAELINGKEGFDNWMIDEEAWECIWNELITNKKGLKTFLDRPDGEDSYNFSFEMYNEMWYQLERLINKYGSQGDQVAQELVALLIEYQESLNITPESSLRLSYEELMTYHLSYQPFFPDQRPFTPPANSTFYENLRTLKVTDVMGPRTRAAYNKMKKVEDDVSSNEGYRILNRKETTDFSKLDEYLRQQRLGQIKSTKGMFGL